MDNKTAADFHQRKMSLLRPSPSESHDYSTQQTITPDFASPAGKLFSDNFGYEEDQPSTNIPFTSSALKASTPSTIQGNQPPTPSELYGNGIAPLRFIHGRQIPANINHQAESSQSPPPFPAGRHPLSTVKTPIEKANEFINRVKQLDSMYLTRSQDPIEENPTNNRNVSYLHENTFTGSLSRLESTQTAVNNGGNQPNSKKNLTNALTSFLKVIEKCQDTSIKAKQLVHQMDHGINQIGTTSSIASSQRSVSPNSLPRHMSPTISYKGKVSPSASQRNNMRINTTAQSTFAPSSVSPSPSTGGIRRSMSPASSLNGSFHYPTSEKKGRWKNFFDNDDPTPLNNSFQSLYNVNNSANLTSAASVVSSNSRYSSPTHSGSRNRSNSPKIRYSIHKEPLSAHKSPVTFSFASGKKR